MPSAPPKERTNTLPFACSAFISCLNCAGSSAGQLL
ncbi:Uncharacterised protein [Vibrio cholerae]|nr:Uncharacterised protein [Vibrio cholerae]